MKLYTTIIIILITILGAFAQIDQDTLKIKEVVISAMRSEKNKNEIPVKVDLISAKNIENLAVVNVDDIFNSISNVYVNRSWGPFSKNSSVTMRGLSSSARVLVLLDGMPLNMAAGGSINWHMIDADNVSQIEITKGPNSALYGNNAMGGVISIISKRPKSPITVHLNSYGGSYKTFGQHITITGNRVNDEKGLYWGIKGFARQGDGYYFESEASRDYSDTTTYIWEYNTGGYLGYQFNKDNKIEVSGDFYDDLRNEGIQVYEKDGSYYKFTTKTIQANYVGKFKGFEINAIGYRKQQDYFNQKERLNNFAEYKLMESSSTDIDEGVWIGVNRKIGEKHFFTFGSDIKHGETNYADIYFTSYDEVYYTGAFNFYALFLQDEYNLNKKIKIVGGLRFDKANFYDGSFSVNNPTSETGYENSMHSEYTPETWNAISYKFATNYSFSEKVRNYLSVATGFTPPKLDDLCRSGKISKGIKIANPELQPEKIFNIETGTFITLHKLEIEPSIYYSRGKDFHYLVGLGDTVDIGGEQRALLQKQNVSDVEILGAEINVKFQINQNLNLITNYSFNHSTIKDYKTSVGTELTGKYLAEVPPHLFYIGLYFNHKRLASSIAFRFIDEQWIDDENTLLVEKYSIVDFKISYQINKYFASYIDIQNLLDVEFVDRKGLSSPGRFILVGIKTDVKQISKKK